MGDGGCAVTGRARRSLWVRTSVVIAVLGALGTLGAFVGPARRKVPEASAPKRGDERLPPFATEAQRRTYVTAVAEGRRRFRASLEGAIAVAKAAGSRPDVERLTMQLAAVDAEVPGTP